MPSTGGADAYCGMRWRRIIGDEQGVRCDGGAEPGLVRCPLADEDRSARRESEVAKARRGCHSASSKALRGVNGEEARRMALCVQSTRSSIDTS